MKTAFRDGAMGLTLFFLSAATVFAGDKPAVEAVPGTTAITSPTPQPPQPESSIHPQSAPVPDLLKQDKNGAPRLAVEFDLDRYDIPPAFQPSVDVFGRYLAAHPDSVAVLGGHADNSGHGPANQSLSLKRANAVMGYLVSHYAIDPNRIKTEGYGQKSDRPSNSTAAAKQTDRSVYGVIKPADYIRAHRS